MCIVLLPTACDQCLQQRLTVMMLNVGFHVMMSFFVSEVCYHQSATFLRPQS
eukprot:m.309184 g.309184  ORF g.309184 m.309184 type:complete len:52 (-) comp15945_c0_seq5:2566-2721(-)